MSSVLAAVVFHPQVNQSLKLWSTTVGRDKTYRTIQYLARFLSYYLKNFSAKQDLAVRLGALKSALGSGRKMLRLFKPLEHAQAALKAASGSAEYPIEQFTTIGRQLGYFGYLSLDMIVWLNSIKVLRLEKDQAKNITKMSQRFWLTGIAFNIACGIAKSQRLTAEVKELERDSIQGEKSSVAAKQAQLVTVAKSRYTARRQLAQDCLDIWLPLTSLEFASLSDGQLGLIGAVTSIMALRLQWAKAAAK